MHMTVLGVGFFAVGGITACCSESWSDGSSLRRLVLVPYSTTTTSVKKQYICGARTHAQAGGAERQGCGGWRLGLRRDGANP